jgi:hypothetical protein
MDVCASPLMTADIEDPLQVSLRLSSSCTAVELVANTSTSFLHSSQMHLSPLRVRCLKRSSKNLLQNAGLTANSLHSTSLMKSFHSVAYQTEAVRDQRQSLVTLTD